LEGSFTSAQLETNQPSCREEETSKLGMIISTAVRLGNDASRVNDCKAIGGSVGEKDCRRRVGEKDAHV
jgi:hypothetical protein